MTEFGLSYLTANQTYKLSLCTAGSNPALFVCEIEYLVTRQIHSLCHMLVQIQLSLLSYFVGWDGFGSRVNIRLKISVVTRIKHF